MASSYAPRTDTLPVTALLTGIVVLAPLSIDMFLPSMPAMGREFGSDEAVVQLGVTLFLAGYAVSQLIFGSLSDRFGRQPALLSGLALYTAGGVICLLASGVGLLLAGRVVQGLAAGSGPSVGRAVVRDIHGRDRAAIVLSYMAVAQALAPMLAPVAGGLLQAAFGWRSVFIVMTALGGLFTAGYRTMLPETNRHLDRAALRPRRLFVNYVTLLTDRGFVAYALAAGLLFCGQFVFISSSAFVLIDELGLSPQSFGIAFGFASFGLMSGAFLAGRLVHRFGIDRLVAVGVSLGMSAGIAMAAISWQGGGVWGILLPMYLFAVAGGLVRPPATAGAIVPWPRMAGLASALFGFVQMAGASVYVMLFGLVFDGSPRMMAGGIATAGTLAAVAFLLLGPRRHLRRT